MNKIFGNYQPLRLEEYLRFMDKFFRTGEFPSGDFDLTSDEPFKRYEDPILGYMREHFSNPVITIEILSDPLHAIAYRNAMAYFISEIIKMFNLFHKDIEITADEKSPMIEHTYRKSLKEISEAIGNGSINDSQLDIIKDCTDWGRNLDTLSDTIQLLSKRTVYPSFSRILSLLGKKTADLGSMKIKANDGFLLLNHAGESDIQGITTGQSFRSLLPIETALFSDAQTENLFFLKYASHHLQIFHHNSNQGNLSRSLNTNCAKSRGPMIVCLDTSRSMEGFRMEIARELISNTLIEARRYKRDCLLIVFSEEIEVINLSESWRKWRGKAFYGYKGFLDHTLPVFYGGTDITNLLIEVFNTLDNHPVYQMADVLVISDFEIPTPSQDLLSKMHQYRKMGHRFYGYKIGHKSSDIEIYFDKIIPHAH